MLLAAPPHAVVVTPTREIRTAAPVNEVAVDGGRAATLVGETREWEYTLVWSPRGIVIRTTLSCDTQESNVVLAGNRFAHVCYQGFNYVVTATIKPVRGHVALKTSGRSVVSLEGGDALVFGSVSAPGSGGSFSTAIWRFDERAKTKLRTYRSRAVLVGVDGDRLLVDRPTALDVLTRSGKLVSTLKRAHEGGAVMRGGRVASLAGRLLTVSGVDGRSVVTRTLAAHAHVDDIDGNLVLYSVDTAVHLLRLTDGKDVMLRFKRQFGYVHARLWHGALFYAYNQQSGPPGHAGYLAPATVRALLGS